MALPSARMYAWVLALLRIYVGLFWLSRAIPKFMNPAAFLPPNGSMSLTLAHAGAMRGPLHAFFVGTILPHADIYAQVIRAGELVAGALLLLGLFTRVGGLLGVLLGGAALLAQPLTPIGAWSNVEAAAVAMSAINLLLPTGRALGLDGVFGRKPLLYEDLTDMPIPPARPEPPPPQQPQPQPTSSTVEATTGVIVPPPPAPVVGPNGSNGGPEFGAPAAAGPRVDQETQSL